MVAPLLSRVFELVCGQNPMHTWVYAQGALPFCQRCTGMYTGALIGAFLLVTLRPRPGGWFLWLHGVFLLQMVPQGFHLVPQNAFLRLTSGYLFGAAVASYLSLPWWWGRGIASSARSAGYLGALAGGFLLVTITVFSGLPVAGPAVCVAGTGGLVVLVVLAVAHGVALLGRWRPSRARVVHS